MRPTNTAVRILIWQYEEDGIDMKQYKTTAEIKATAKKQLLGKYGTTIGAALILLATTLFLSSFALMEVNPDSMLSIIFYRVILFLIELFMGILISGNAYLYMNVIYDQPVTSSDLFFGFRQHPDKAILIQLAFSLADLVCSLPGFIYDNVSGSSYHTALSYSIDFIFIIVYLFIALMLSQSFYILQDYPDKSVPDILKTSIRLMQGNKWRMIRLLLSFIPLFLLCIITLIIPMLWLNSYVEASLAAFYQDLIAASGKRNNA